MSVTAWMSSVNKGRRFVWQWHIDHVNKRWWKTERKITEEGGCGIIKEGDGKAKHFSKTRVMLYCVRVDENNLSHCLINQWHHWSMTRCTKLFLYYWVTVMWQWVRKSPSDRSQWTLRWSRHHLGFYPFSVGENPQNREKFHISEDIL